MGREHNASHATFVFRFDPAKEKRAFEETVGTLKLCRVKESISGGRVRLMLCIFFLESVNCPPHMTLDVLRPHLVKESHYKRRKPLFKNHFTTLFKATLSSYQPN